MPPLKTRPSDADAGAFIDAIGHPRKRADAHTIVAMMSDLIARSVADMRQRYR